MFKKGKFLPRNCDLSILIHEYVLPKSISKTFINNTKKRYNQKEFNMQEVLKNKS